MRKYEVIFDEEDAAYYASRDQIERSCISVAKRLAEAYEKEADKYRDVETNLWPRLSFD